MKSRKRQSASNVSAVPKQAKQGTEALQRDWSWVEASIWTESMLAALEKGVKGGKWSQTVATFFAEEGLFTMMEARSLACQSRC